MPHPEKKHNTAIQIDFVSHLINNYHNAQLDRYKITCKQAKVLTYLVHHQGEDILQKDIEQVFFLRSSTVTSVMQNLEKAEFIERYTSKKDKRMKRILITAKGYEVFEQCEQTIEQLQEFLFADWSEQDQFMIRTLLNRIVDKLKPIRNCKCENVESSSEAKEN